MKPLISVPWCMSGSLTRSGGENVPGIPDASATHNFTYLARGPRWHFCLSLSLYSYVYIYIHTQTNSWTYVRPILRNVPYTPWNTLIIWEIWCQKRESQAGISTCIPQCYWVQLLIHAWDTNFSQQSHFFVLCGILYVGFTHILQDY